MRPKVQPELRVFPADLELDRSGLDNGDVFTHKLPGRY
jgi:hypothetical protein